MKRGEYLFYIPFLLLASLLGIWGFLGALWLILILIRHKPVDITQQEKSKTIEEPIMCPKLLKVPVELYENYRVYLKSDVWRELRQQRFRLDGHRCTRCGYIGTDKQVHHTHYEGIKDMDFSLDQLETVCTYCHKRIHHGELPMSKDN